MVRLRAVASNINKPPTLYGDVPALVFFFKYAEQGKGHFERKLNRNYGRGINKFRGKPASFEITFLANGYIRQLAGNLYHKAKHKIVMALHVLYWNTQC